MAKNLLDLPLSGRQNIIKWIESFSNSGMGLNESTLDLFDAGNNYTSNAKVDDFNKKVGILVRAFKSIGMPIKRTPKGRYSITFAMLKKLTLNNMTDELKDFIFDESLSELKFDDKNADKVMAKLKSEGKDFSSFRYFNRFLETQNLIAIDWLVKNYKYTLRHSPLEEAVRFFAEKNNHDIVDNLIDIYIKNGLISKNEFIKGKWYYHPNWFRKNISELSLRKLIKFITLPNSLRDFPSTNMFNGVKSGYFDIKNDLLNNLTFSDDEWKKMAGACKQIISDKKSFREYETYIKKLMELSDVFTQELINSTDWSAYTEFLSLIPEIKDIFIF